MEYESEEHTVDSWIADGERWICQLPAVRQCRIDLDENGEVSGLHIVAGEEREAGEIVRDAIDLLNKRLDVRVSVKKVGLVQLVAGGNEPGAEPVQPQPRDSATILAPDTAEPTPANAAAPLPDEDVASEVEPTPAVLLTEEPTTRLQCSGVGVMSSNALIRAEVELQAGDVEARGTAEGPNRSDGDVELIGRATIQAIRQLVDEPIVLDVAEVRITNAGGQEVAMAAVELVEDRRVEHLYGTCATRPNRQQAIVYAILDALNRRLALLALKSERTGD